jgi:ABC-type multidrug transport system ATPase subunit
MAIRNVIPYQRAADHAPAIVAVAGLSKRYGEQRALAEVSFDLRAGELLGLIGPNGAGKTTLLEALAGVLPADAGHVTWAGAELAPVRRRELMFYLPDGLRPWDDQYVTRVLAFFAGVYARPWPEVAATVRRVGLTPVLDKRVAALSKGYGRRLMLALALIAPHPVLLLDEPFDGFDLRQTRDMMAVLRALAADGRALLLAIHQLADAERICDRFMLLADGTLRGFGTLAELRARTALPKAALEEVFLALT